MEVSQLEDRLLFSAVNDVASLSGSQSSIEIDVLANDTGLATGVASVSSPTNATNGAMVTVSNGKITYSLPAAMMAKTLGDYSAALARAELLISNWHATEQGQIATHYSAVNTSIDRFATFLGGAVSDLSAAGGAAGGVGTYLGGGSAIAGKAIGFLAQAAAANIGASNTAVINAAHQKAAIAQAQAVAAAAQHAQQLTDSLAAQIAQVGSPKIYSDDSFTYVGVEMQMVPMPGMPGMMMMTPVSSMATVSVTVALTDYSAMVMNVNNWQSAHQSEMHMYAGAPDLDRIYGDMLRSYATSQGWAIVWQGPNISFTPHWYCAMTDWPFILDGTDIASELNSIGYQP